MEDYQIWDITPLISPRIAVWPGDVSFTRETSLSFSAGHNLELSSIHSTLHLGAHADASNHYHPDGKGIEKRELRDYMGRAQVISVQIAKGSRIYPQDLKGVVIQAPRVLFKTGSFPNPDKWQADFNSLSPELIANLHSDGVKLIGIDTPSVDPMESKKLESHQAIYQHQMVILEGLLLKDVADGLYTLMALPLPMEGADASPVRAVLARNQQNLPLF